MTDYLKYGAGIGGAVVGVFVSIALLASAPQMFKGCSSVSDTLYVTVPETLVVHESTSTAIHHHPAISDTVIVRLDSLKKELSERDSALASALVRLTDTLFVSEDWLVEGDSSVAIGRLTVEWCPLNGVFYYDISIDTLLVPEHILEITKTVYIQTGIEWYWLPIAVAIGVLVGVWIL